MANSEFTNNKAQRFWKHVQRGGVDECWPWQRAVTHGYGHTQWEGRNVGAHRVAWFLTRGPIPAGLSLDHLCRNRRCCNPAHLEVVTTKENVLRGIGRTARHARQTHCIHGHPFTGANLRVDLDRQAIKHRTCKRCQVLQTRRRKAKLLMEKTGLSVDVLSPSEWDAIEHALNSKLAKSTGVINAKRLELALLKIIDTRIKAALAAHGSPR